MASSVLSVKTSPVSVSWMPYSEIESLRRTASSRSATLCCFEPVKWWSRLPYDSGGTTRRSKRRPSLATTVAFVLPLATISSTHGSCVKWSISATGSLAVAMMSRSRTCSLRRRTLPASLTWSAAGCSRRSATTARTAGSARPRSGFCSIFFFGVASALRTFSSVFGPSPVSVRSCSVSAAFFRSASVSTPSSCQIRRAVFGPRPGQVHELDDVRRRIRLALGEGLDPAVFDDLDDLLLDRLADPGQLLRLPVHGELRDRAAGLPHALSRAPVRERTELVAAFELQEVGQEVELVRDVCVPGECLRHHRDDMGRAQGHLSADLQRAREPGADGARAGRARAGGARGARHRRRVAGRDRGDRGPARGGAALGARAAPRAEGGARACVPGRLRAGARARRGLRLRDGLRLLARPGGRAAARRGRGGRRSRARVPLRGRRRHTQLGRSCGASSRAAGRSTLRCCFSSGSAT